MSAAVEAELEAAEQAFNAAMVSNDLDRIRGCITPDWFLVTPEAGPVPAKRILGLIADGTLGHHTMTKTSHLIRVMGEVAIVTGRGWNTGWYRGAPIAADEWITDVYRRIDGRWRCTLTHLAPALGPIAEGGNDAM
jgi:ketosteroid isomerase-like protein